MLPSHTCTYTLVSSMMLSQLLSHTHRESCHYPVSIISTQGHCLKPERDKRPPSSFNQPLKMSPGYFYSSRETLLQLDRSKRERRDKEEMRRGVKERKWNENQNYALPFLPLNFPGFRSEHFPPCFLASKERKEFMCDLLQLHWELIKNDEKKRCHPVVDYSASHLPLDNNTSRSMW